MSTKSYLEYQRTAQLADKLSDEYLLFWMEHKNLTSCTNCESITNCEKMQNHPSLSQMEERMKKKEDEIQEKDKKIKATENVGTSRNKKN